MNSIEFLKQENLNLEFEKLNQIINERKKWIENPANKHLTSVLEDLKPASTFLSMEDEKVFIKGQAQEDAIDLAKKLIPWRKGPFTFLETFIDSEWRSDMKWDRIKDVISPLEDKLVLDIGCNNGYFMFQMAKQNPKFVLGIDPVVHNYCQFHFLNHFAGCKNLYFEMIGVEHMNLFHQVFDTIFSMGIIYHHRNPISQLVDIRNALKPGGELIIETIGIPGEQSYALFPEDRYAKMKNVWFVPTLSCFINWVRRAKFIDVEIVSDTELTFDEQRNTSWCPRPFQSLEDFLDKNNTSKTIEGHEAPRRFCLKAKKKPL